MAKYLVQANYVGDGENGLLKDGGSGRVAVLNKLVESIGGTLESCYFAFGDCDILGASLTLTVNASGLVTAKRPTAVLKKENGATGLQWKTRRK